MIAGRSLSHSRNSYLHEHTTRAQNTTKWVHFMTVLIREAIILVLTQVLWSFSKGDLEVCLKGFDVYVPDDSTKAVDIPTLEGDLVTGGILLLLELLFLPQSGLAVLGKLIRIIRVIRTVINVNIIRVIDTHRRDVSRALRLVKHQDS